MALLYMAVSVAAANTAKITQFAQGRRPPSSDVDAIEAENFEVAAR